jgi:nucleotide-binding universal stress UspA family protein
MFERIVVGVNPTESAQLAAEKAQGLAEALGAELHLVCAFTAGASSALSSSLEGAVPSSGPHRATTPGGGVAREHAESFLARLARASEVTTETHALPGDAAEAILRVCKEKHADLVVVGNKGMRGARRVLGSVPNTVSHQAPCAVLIVHTV